MKFAPAFLTLALFASASAFAQKAGDKSQPVPKPIVKNVSPDDAEKLIAQRKDVVVVDVRTVEEFDMGHIAGAKNMSLIDNDFAEKLKEIEGKPVLVHCAAGSRSLRAVMKMEASGKFPEIYHLTSGFSGWQDAGKSVVKSPKAAK